MLTAKRGQSNDSDCLMASYEQQMHPADEDDVVSGCKWTALRCLACDSLQEFKYGACCRLTAIKTNSMTGHHSLDVPS